MIHSFVRAERSTEGGGLQSTAELAQERIERFAEMRLKHFKLCAADRNRARKIVNDTESVAFVLAPRRSLAPPRQRWNLLNAQTINQQLSRSPGSSLRPLMLGAGYRARLFQSRLFCA